MQIKPEKKVHAEPNTDSEGNPRFVNVIVATAAVRDAVNALSNEPWVQSCAGGWVGGSERSIVPDYQLDGFLVVNACYSIEDAIAAITAAAEAVEV